MLSSNIIKLWTGQTLITYGANETTQNHVVTRYQLLQINHYSHCFQHQCTQYNKQTIILLYKEIHCNQFTCLSLILAHVPRKSHDAKHLKICNLYTLTCCSVGRYTLTLTIYRQVQFITVFKISTVLMNAMFISSNQKEYL